MYLAVNSWLYISAKENYNNKDSNVNYHYIATTAAAVTTTTNKFNEFNDKNMIMKNSEVINNNEIVANNNSKIDIEKD